MNVDILCVQAIQNTLYLYDSDFHCFNLKISAVSSQETRLSKSASCLPAHMSVFHPHLLD